LNYICVGTSEGGVKKRNKREKEGVRLEEREGEKERKWK
jgi:hypothetical protein